MALVARTALVKPSVKILSSYPIGASRDKLKPLYQTGAGFCPQDVAIGLEILNNAVLKLGGDLRITDMFRDYETQKAAHQKYLNWANAGRPRANSPDFDKKTMKADFVAAPGFSMHNAGRAIDVHIEALKFPKLSVDKQLDKLWEIAIPLGWTPIIKAPTEGVTESWHFDYFSYWQATRLRLSYAGVANVYGMIAMCSCLDEGIGGYGNDEARALQVQLHRIGQNPGAVDGDIGAKTEKALGAAGFDKSERDYTKLFSLETVLGKIPVIPGLRGIP